MASAQSTARLEREKKLKQVFAFGSSLTKRLGDEHDNSLIDDLQSQIRGLPLQPSSTLTARQHELDKLGIELWNLSTRLRRGESAAGEKRNEESVRRNRCLCLLRVFSFLLLDSATVQAKGRPRKSCFRLMPVALKAARVCIDSNETSNATKILERAAEYQDILSQSGDGTSKDEAGLADRLRLEYFAIRTTLAWRQDRMDTAEHMFAKCKQLDRALTPKSAEDLADLLYDIGRDCLAKHAYESAIRWLERAHDVLEEQDMAMLSNDAGELRLSTMHGIVQAYMKLGTPEAMDKAWNMVKLMQTDYADKMLFSLLKIELLSAAETMDTSEFYSVLLRMIRSIVLNETNFKTIMHYIHKLKEHSNVTACKILDDFVDIRLLKEEDQAWIEKAIILRIWFSTANDLVENALEQLQELFDSVSQNSKASFSTTSTHAAQTLLWKRAETSANQERHNEAEAWCRICLHPLFDKSGDQNKAKIARKIIQCALSKQDYAAARHTFNEMSGASRDEPLTRYLMYRTGLKTEDVEFATECMDVICRNSAHDATLLYACVMEAQSSGDKRQAIAALEKLLDKYDHCASAGIHLPALLRCTARLLQSEIIKDGKIEPKFMNQLCNVFEGALMHVNASRRRPANPSKELFTSQEIEWFSKNAYNLSMKHCAEMAPSNLVRLLNACIGFIKLLRDADQSDTEGDLCLRLVFCEFLSACAYTTLARAEDNIETYLQYYLEARKHCQEFRRAAADGIDKLGGSAQADIISKHFQVVKLELETVLKLEKWDELDDLFDQCWKYKSPDHYETLADLVLVIHSCVSKAGLDTKYQKKVLSVLHKIINLTSRQPGADLVKLSRWLRCLFSISLTLDETTSLKCIEQAVNIATKQQGEVDRYPSIELEWLATTTFNHGVDYYLQEDDKNCQKWAEHAFILAQWLDDNGALRDLLMEKYASLKLQDQDDDMAS